MIETLVWWVLYLMAIGLIVGLLLYLNDALKVPEPFHAVIRAVILVVGVLIVILLLLNLIGVLGAGGARLRF